MNIFQNLLYLNLFSFLYLQIYSKQKEEEDNFIGDSILEEYNSLLNWAKNHSLNITNKIKLTKIEEDKQFIAVDKINQGDLILDIPPNITLNVKTFYKYFPSKNLEQKYDNYVKIGKKSNLMLNDLSFIDQSFMAFLFYEINRIKENETDSELNKFNEYYKHLFFIFNDDLGHLPSSFTDKQINKFMNTSFNSFFNLMNGYLSGELEILKNEIFKEKDINLNEYFKYRFILLQKSFNISNITTLVPFVDLIKRDFNNDNVNCKLVVNKGHIRIKATKDINKDELIIIKPRKMTNQYSYFFYGKTYDELVDYMPSFIVPIIIPNLLLDEGIELNIDENEEENKIDLVWDKFYDIILPTYQEILKMLNREDTKINCYNLILKYLVMIRDAIKMNKIDDLEDIFEDERDIDNIKRIIKGEIIFLDKKINELELVIKNYKKENKIKSNKKKVKEESMKYEDL